MARTLERSLDLTIRLKTNEEGEVSQIEIDTLEPESGTPATFTFPYSVEEHPEFDEVMGRELYSWISLWAEQLEEEPECGDEEEEEDAETCPVCGASIELCDGEDDGYGELRMSWPCDKCGTEGDAFFDLTDGNRFDRHEWDKPVNGHTDEPPQKRNTEISYLYCDGSNYKIHTDVVVEGCLTTDEIETILKTCDAGEFFIPAQVGLPETRFEDTDEQDDHVWFTLPDDAFSPTDCEPTVPITAKELLENFKRVDGNWVEEEAGTRLWDC